MPAITTTRFSLASADVFERHYADAAAGAEFATYAIRFDTAAATPLLLAATQKPPVIAMHTSC